MKGRFNSAVRALATSDDTIQRRLADAGRYLVVPVTEMPAELREKFVALMNDLTSRPAQGNESPVDATTRALTAEQAEKLAERILQLYTDLLGGL